MRFRLFILVALFCGQSCVSSHIFEDAQVIGKNNRAVEGSLARAVYKPTIPSPDALGAFYRTRDVGTFRASYVHGLTDRIEAAVTLDFPVGLRAKVKYQLPWKSIRHLHSVKADFYLPVSYYLLKDIGEFPQIGLGPTYMYTYRHDDLLSISTNATFMSIKTNDRFAHIPGISAGFHVGDEIRFSAGVSYFDNFGKLGATRIQYLSVEAGIRYDL